MGKILFLEPIFMEKVWGGDKLKHFFNFKLPSRKTGECWAISGLEEAPTKIKSGVYAGKTLREVYKESPELFKGAKTSEFPLLVKFIDANQDLSVQVHPNDKYANTNENGSLGKNEAWFVLDAESDTKIVYGHNAKNKKELFDMIDNNKWNELLKIRNVNKNDFFYVPAGTIHALKSGTLIIEVQQSSNITYRLYDYNRPGLDGNPRELHIEKAKDVITVPFKKPNTQNSLQLLGNSTINCLLKSKHFEMYLIQCRDELILENKTFLLATVLNGRGKVNDIDIKSGDSFIVTSLLKDVEISGQMSIMISHL